MINISYLQVPLDNDSKLRDAMWITAEPLYINTQIEFNQLHRMVSSDYRQYSPFKFIGGVKKSENWNNSEQNILILDVDDGLTINEAKDIFKEYKYLIATTKSHNIAKKGLICDRYRIILESDNIPSGEAYFKMMEFMKIKYPFIDEQVNTMTGAFLGYAGCEFWYNYGKKYDCSSLISGATRMMMSRMQDDSLKREPIKDIQMDNIKASLDQQTVSQIVESCGFNVNRNFKFKYRQEERTPSASIRKDGYIKDFGSDLAGDIISFVQEVKGIDFKSAVSFVAGFVNVSVS